MAKFLKSIFSSEKKKAYRFDGDEEDRNDFTPPLDDRRKLSISRSGRMRQANKKRHSLSMDVYGEINQIAEKPRSMEYHVNTPLKSVVPPSRRHSGDPKNTTGKDTRNSAEITPKNITGNDNRKNAEIIPEDTKGRDKRKSAEITPEEEIDSAFEIIDRIS